MIDRIRAQLHVSALNTLSTCGIQFENIYIKGIRRRPSAFLIAGTGVHKGIEYDLLNKIDTGDLLPEDLVTDIVAEEVEAKDKWDNIEFEDEDEKTIGKDNLIGKTKDKAIRLVRVHHKEIAPDINPLPRSDKLPNGGVSRKFSINLDGFLRERAKQFYEDAEKMNDKRARKHLESIARSLNAAAKQGFDFCGEVDIQHMRQGKIWIRDSKTAGKSPAKDKETGRYGVADNSEQLSAYALAIKVLDGTMPDGVALDFLIDTKEPKKIICESTRTIADAEMFLNRVISAVHVIKTGSFVPASTNSWWCSKKWCGFWDSCIYASHPKNSSQLVNIDF